MKQIGTLRITAAAFALLILLTFIWSCAPKPTETKIPTFTLTPTDKFLFNSFVDCNMAEVWVGDTFRIFPGKYGEDTLWGYSDNLRFGNGAHADEAFSRKYEELIMPNMPKNVKPGEAGLHGAVWFETVYQDAKDPSGKTLYAVYHNENYPWNYPYDEKTGEGYLDKYWPRGLTGATSPAAVCRIGIMKSTDGGYSWDNRGIFIEDLQPRMILKPHNTSNTFAGGVGDPSAVASGDYLYLFYGEYGYPGVYDSATYDPAKEWSGQCISIARIKLSDLDNPVGKARRWDGKGFNAMPDAFGAPVASLQIPMEEGGGPASSPDKMFHWGPSVSWNTYLNCWVMMMGRVESSSWVGSAIYLSFNFNKDLSEGDNSQQWTKPIQVLNKEGHTLWYPSLQPMNTPEDIENKYTCVRLGKRARLFFKDMWTDERGFQSEYKSEYIIEFER
jgi:hypothetical protein